MNSTVERFNSLIETVKNANEAQLEDFLHAYILIIFIKKQQKNEHDIDVNWEALANNKAGSTLKGEQEEAVSNFISAITPLIKANGLQATPLEQLDKTSLYNLLSFIASYPFEQSTLNIALKELHHYQKKYFKDGWTVPVELKEFIHELVTATVKSKALGNSWCFYDPFSRLGGIAGLELMKAESQPKEVFLNCQQSLDYQISTMLQTLLLPNSRIHVSNRINPLDTNSHAKESVEKNIQADILATLPSFGRCFGLKESQPYMVEGLKRMVNTLSTEAATVQLALHTLKEKGIAMVIVPDGLLVRRGDGLALRKYLIDGGHIQAIISFPSNLLHQSAVKTSLLILQKSGNVGQPIKIIQVKRQLGKIIGKVVSDILNHNATQLEEKGLQYVTYKEINPEEIENYNLNPSYYLEQENLPSSQAVNSGKEWSMPHSLVNLKKEYFERKEALDEAMKQWEKVVCDKR